MYIERVPNRNSPPAVLLRESYREGDKVRKKTLANLSKLPDDVIENLRIVLKGGVAKVRSRFGLLNVVWVGDRGMLTSARINEEFKNQEGLDWITALTSVQIRKLAEDKVIQLGLFDEKNLVELSFSAYPGERLMACRNPIVADSKIVKREKLLEATEIELDKIVTATKREKRALKGADNIGLRVGKIINKYQVGKFFNLEITEESFSYSRKVEALQQQDTLDGLYVIRTSVDSETLDAPSTVKTYKSLSVVEQAFRSYKTMDLKVRPIYHYLANRVRAHGVLCLLAYYVEWHMKRALASLLFRDEDWELKRKDKADGVSQAKRSKKALNKARRKKTEDHLPVHSFSTLMADLGTITLNTIQSKLDGNLISFEKITQPTPLQQKALDLLDVSLLCTQ